MFGKLVAGLAVVALASTATASVVIDFSDLEIDNNLSNDVGESYSALGFTISKGVGEFFPFVVYGQQESRYPGQAALYNNTINGLIILQQDDGGTFDMTSIDLAPLNSATPVQVTFRGYLGGMEVATQSFTHSGSAIALETFVFSGDFLGIDRLEWNQIFNDGFHQFSNLTMGALPAPGALALLGMAGLVGARRRRG